MNRDVSCMAARLAVALALLSGAAAWAAGAHVHGELRADVAVDGQVLTVALQMPLDTLVGFEHRPRNARQRQAADEALARVREVGAWLRPAPQARCVQAAMTLQAGALEAAPAGAAEPAHGDLDLQVEFRCAVPQALDRVELAVFERFPRAHRVEVQVASPAGQWRQVLKRPQRDIALRR